jgi:hypothetical protein
MKGGMPWHLRTGQPRYCNFLLVFKKYFLQNAGFFSILVPQPGMANFLNSGAAGSALRIVVLPQGSRKKMKDRCFKVKVGLRDFEWRASGGFARTCLVLNRDSLMRILNHLS